MRTMVVIMLTLLGWLLSPLVALAQSTPSVDRELALALARTTWNESSSWASPDDMYLLWQVIEGHGETNAERLAWLRAHSSCVNSSRPMTDRERQGNCIWSRHLTWGPAEPVGWREGENVPWNGEVQRRWARTRELAMRLVGGADYPRLCPVAPDTWGGTMDPGTGLIRVECSGDADNTGYLYPRRSA